MSLLTAASTRMGDAGPKGRGLFASRRIAKSATVGTFTAKSRWIWDIPKEVWPHTIQVDYDRYVVPRRDGPLWLINHSCEPNCVIAGRKIVAERDIAKGEELTFDYSTDVDWPGFKMNCTCGARQCREVIRAYRFLSAELRLRYGGHVAPFIQREYLRKGSARASRPSRPAGRRAAPQGL